jgi:hypothetical protein
VEPGAVARASDVLSKAGYRDGDHLTPEQLQCCELYANSLNFIHHSSGIAVDLHWAAWPDWFSSRQSAVFFRAGTERLSVCGRDVLAKSAEVTLLMLCCHGAKHAWPALSFVCDVHELVCSTPALDWQGLLNQGRQLRAERLLLLGLSLAQRLLGTPLPMCAQEQLSSVPVVSYMAADMANRILTGPAGSGALIPGVLLRAQRGLAQKIICTLRFAFKPSFTDICSVRLPRPFFLLYHVVRPMRLLRKYGFSVLGRA